MIKIKIKGARCSGKSTIADIIENALKIHGFYDTVVDDGLDRHYGVRTSYHIKALADRTKIKIKVDNK